MVIRFLLVLFLMPLLAFGQMATGQTRRLIVPNNLGNFTTWWKADSITGLTNNAPVTSWLESYGANNLTGSGSTAPLWVTNVSGSNPGVKFDGSDDLMSMASTLTLVVQSATVITVASVSANGMEFGSSTVNMQYQASPALFLFNSTDSSTPASSAFTSGTNICVGIYKDTGNPGTFRENKTSRGGTGGGNNSFTFDRMGRWKSAGTAFNGTIFEVLIYSRILSNFECDFIYDKYLKPKYPGLP